MGNRLIEASSMHLARRPNELDLKNKIEEQPNGLLKICTNVDMHPSEPFSGKFGKSLKDDPIQNVSVFTANELAIALGRQRYADINLSLAFPGIPGKRPQDAYEHSRASEIGKFYRENTFDIIADFHNCGTLPFSESAHMKPRTAGNGLLHEKLLVAAGIVDLFNIVLLDEYTFLNQIDNAFSIELPRPTGTEEEQMLAYESQISAWRKKLARLTHYRPDQLSFDYVKDFKLNDFTFYRRDREISRAQAKELGLENFVVHEAFEELPEEVAQRLGYRNRGFRGPLFAEYWNYNCDANEIPNIDDEREWFGSILTDSHVNHLIEQGHEDLVLAT
jgi:hypothetical protein